MENNSKSGVFERFIPVLLIVVVLMAGVVGALWQKVSQLEKGGVAAGKGDVYAPTAAAGNPTEGKLTDDQVKKLEKISDKDHIIGNKDAKVSLIVYTDLECPFCKQFHTTLLQAQNEYKDKINVLIRHFPLTFHQNAQKEAEATECVAELAGNDVYKKFIDKIFERTTSNGTGFALAKLGPLAKEVGVNQASFQTCLDSGKYAQKVSEQQKGGETAGVNGTPGTFIVNKNGGAWLLPGAYPYESLKGYIEEALK